MSEQENPEQQEQTAPAVFSVKLINGLNLLAELKVDMETESYMVINPILVDLSEGNKAEAREFDPMTNESVTRIPWAHIICQPNKASELFVNFYAQSLINAYRSRAQFFVSMNRDMELSEFDKMQKTVEADVVDYSQKIRARFGLDGGEEHEPALVPERPDGVTVH